MKPKASFSVIMKIEDFLSTSGELLMKSKTNLVLLLFVVSYFSLPCIALSGTIDNATLTPTSASINPGESVELIFSARNDYTNTLQSYQVTLGFDSGLTVSSLTTSPVAASQKVNASKNTVAFSWDSVAPGEQLTASFTVSGDVEGQYSVYPSAIIVSIDKRTRHSGVCNTSTIIVGVQPLPQPSTPSNIRSESHDTSIDINWEQATGENSTEYRVYKRTSTMNFDSSTYFSVPASSTKYIDADVQEGAIYCYAVSAVNSSGAESPMSIETCDMLKWGIRPEILDSFSVNGQPISAAVGDVNGDGIPDLAMGFPNHKKGKNIIGRIDIYFGGGVSSGPISIYGETGCSIGHNLAATDLNNDGYEDLVTGNPYCDVEISSGETAFQAGKVFVYAGGQQISTRPTMTIEGNWAYNWDYSGKYLFVSEHLGHCVAAAGDVNGDGFDDVAIGAPMGGRGRSGSVYILLGGQTITERTVTICGEVIDEGLGYSLAAAGDVNADGYLDIVAGANNNAWNDTGKAYVIYGGQSPQLSSVVNQKTNVDYGEDLAGLDFNGDSYSDIAVSYADRTASHYDIDVYFGGPLLPSSPNITLEESSSLKSLGDINDDGLEDLLAGSTIVFGQSDITISPFSISTYLSPNWVGDWDYDGYHDVIEYDSVTNTVNIAAILPYLDIPIIQVKSPERVTYIRNYIFTGRIIGNVSRLLVFGQESQVQTDGSFSCTASLAEGNNRIEIITESVNGRLAKQTFSIEYQTPPPLTLALVSYLR